MKLLFAVIALWAALQTSSAQDLAELSGRVIDSSTRQPLAGVRVVLFRWEGGTLMYNTVDKAEPMAQPQDPKSPIFSMLTGDDGRFNFKTTPSYFSLYARFGGYVAWGDNPSTSKFLTLKSGQKVNDIVIAMNMPGSISGRVIDPDTEKPIPGLQVWPLAWSTANGSRALVFSGEPASTDKNGAYEIKGLIPGEYILEIAPTHGERFLPGGTQDEFRSNAQLAYLRSFYPGVEQREQAESVTLLPGATLQRTDFKLAKRKAAAIRGCLHSDGDPNQLGDLALSLTLIEQQGSTMAYKSIADKTVRAGACYKIEGLSAGQYYLDASTKVTTPAESQRAFAVLDLDDRKVDNIDLNLARGIQITGKVRLDETVTGAALKDMRLKIHLQPRGRTVFGDELGEESAFEVSAATGNFVVQNGFPGAYRVGFVGLPKGLAVGEVRYNGARTGRNVFAMNLGAPSQQLEIVLRSTTASISITVEGGAKFADSQLVLRPEPYDELDPQQETQTVKADSDGRGTFTDLIAGKFRVFAFPPDAAWRTDPSFVQNMIVGKDVEVSNEATQSVEVKLTQLR